MSFGVGVSDIFEALQLLRSTYQAWRDAPRKYRAIKQRLRTLRVPLRQLARHFQDFQRCQSSVKSGGDVSDIFASIEDILDQLDSILDKRKGLTLWDRLRIGAGDVDSLNAVLDRQIQDLTLLCCSVGLENLRELGHAHEALLQLQQDLKQGQEDLRWVVEQVLLSGTTHSITKAQSKTLGSVGSGPRTSSKRTASSSLPRQQIAVLVALQGFGGECEPSLSNVRGS